MGCGVILWIGIILGWVNFGLGYLWVGSIVGLGNFGFGHKGGRPFPGELTPIKYGCVVAQWRLCPLSSDPFCQLSVGESLVIKIPVQKPFVCFYF